MLAGERGVDSTTRRWLVFAGLVLAGCPTGSSPEEEPVPEVEPALTADDASWQGVGQWLPAGDLTGDGRPDLVMGDPNADGERGAVYVLTPGAPGPLAPELAAVTIRGEIDEGRFGYRVQPVGDVNGDGHPDLLTGHSNAFAAAGFTRALYLFTGPLGEGTRLADAWLTQPFEHGSPGIEGLAAPGDRNGDGFDDLAVVFWSDWQRHLALFDGPEPTGLRLDDADAQIRMPDGFGLRVGESADYDGDGELELPVGLPWDLALNHGWLWLLPADAEGATDGQRERRRLQGPTADDRLGILPTRAGDADGAGTPDLLVGLWGSRQGRGAAAILADPGDSADWPRRIEEEMARTWFWSDRRTGLFNLGVGAAWLDLDGDGLDDAVLGARDAVLGYVAPEPGRLEARDADLRIDGDGLGGWVQELPDVDGDGLPELMTGDGDPIDFPWWGSTWIFASGTLR